MQNAANDYLIDREAQRNDGIYTGITHIAMQDQAITESMGEIVDHSFEHLAPSDQMITRTRRRLLMAARALREKGVVPPCVDQPDIFRQVRSGEAVLAADDWQAAYADRLQPGGAADGVARGGGVARQLVIPRGDAFAAIDGASRLDAACRDSQQPSPKLIAIPASDSSTRAANMRGTCSR